MSSLKNFTLSLDDLKHVGSNFHRPESVLAQPDGTLWVSDGSGGVTRFNPDGTHTVIGSEMGGEANGLAMDSAGNIYIANIASGKLWKLAPDGSCQVVLEEVNGQPLGAVNFVFIYSKDRLWVSIICRPIPWFAGILSGQATGYIVLIDGNGPRIVADNINFCNEVRLDAKEEYLYAAETMGCRILRYKVNEDGSLGPKEVFGPESLGADACVDGFTFDAEGNIWVTTVLRNGLVIITPDGEAHTVFEDPRQDALDNTMAKLATGTLTPEEMFACVGPRVQFPTSVTFAGPDLQTVYMGSLAMPHLLSFRSPVAGLPLRHWK